MRLSPTTTAPGRPRPRHVRYYAAYRRLQLLEFKASALSSTLRNTTEVVNSNAPDTNLFHRRRGPPRFSGGQGRSVETGRAPGVFLGNKHSPLDKPENPHIIFETFRKD